jgi:hypothetical protein
MPKDIATRFYHAVGIIIIQWGYIDATLALICSGLFAEFGGHTAHKVAPRALGRRLDFFYKCFRDKQELAHMAEDVEGICKAIRSVDTYRNFFVHGAMMDYFPEDDAYKFTKLDSKDVRYDNNSTRLTHVRLTEVAKTANEVVLALRAVVQNMQEILRGQKGQQNL